MARASRPALPPLAVLGPCIAAAAAQLLAFWPGIMVWDAIRQYGQAVSGRYDDWHPPAMNWLWRELTVFGAGPAPMLVLQTLLYWTGFAPISLRLARDGKWPRAGLVLALALLPVSLVLVGTILKDSLMAGALLAATGLIAWRRPGDRILGLAAAALLLGAATLRFNAVPACLPLALLLVPPRWRARPVRLLAISVLVAIPLSLAMPVANRLLAAERSHVELSLLIYDLGGITRFSGQDAFPATPVADPVAVDRSCYSPVSWDSYSWWVETPCPIGFSLLQPILAAPGTSAVTLWARAVAMHPVAYAMHRFAHFNQDVRFWTSERRLPPLSLASDPNRWGYGVPPNRLRDRIAGMAVASLSTPLGWPACWLAVAAALLLLGTMEPLPAALAASSLLYGLSYLPLGVASEVRYHLWTMIAAGLAAICGLCGRRPASRNRRVAGIALVLAIATLSVLARLR